MKKTPKTAMIAAAFAAAMAFSSCDGGSSSNGEPANDIVTKNSQTSSYDPSSDKQQGVYGPPNFDPSSQNEPQPEYGAVVDYDPSEPDPQTDYGAPVDYDPSSDEPAEVYGPPSDLGE